jgi:NitT/TauT family transport system substrate-binding protein
MTRRVGPAALLALALSGCGGTPGERLVGMTRLRVLVQPFLSHAPLLIADAEGYFARQGIEVEFVRLSDNASALPMLIDESLDVLTGGPTPAILNAMARGLPVRAVAEKSYFRADGCSRSGMVIRRVLLDSAAGAPPAVRRVSIEKSPQQVYLVERMLEHAGVDPDSVQFLYIQHAAEMEALSAGTLDAALAGEPWITLNVERGAVQWIRAEDVLPDAQFSFLFFGPGLLNADPAIGQRFLAAYLEGVRQFERGRTPENLEILNRITGEGADLTASMCWPPFKVDGRIDFRGVRDFAAWAVTRGLVERVIDETEFWEPAYLEAAHRLLAAQPATSAEKQP